MMLHDEYGNQCRANCKVLPQYEGDKKIPDKYIDTDEAGRKNKRKTRILKELKEEILKNIYKHNMPFAILTHQKLMQCYTMSKTP